MEKTGGILTRRLTGLALRVVATILLWSIGTSGLAVAQEKESEELYSPFMAAALVAPPSGLAAHLPGDRLAGRDLGESQRERVQMAIGLVKRGEYAYAVDLLEPYAQTGDFLALHALGVAYVRLGRNQQAFNVLIRAHNLRPAVAGPLLPAALACARMARSCDDYRELALAYKAQGGKFKRFADKIANHLPFTLAFTRR